MTSAPTQRQLVAQLANILPALNGAGAEHEPASAALALDLHLPFTASVRDGTKGTFVRLSTSIPSGPEAAFIASPRSATVVTSVPLDARACRALQYHPQHDPRPRCALRSFLIAGAAVAFSYATTFYRPHRSMRVAGRIPNTTSTSPAPAAADLHRGRHIRPHRSTPPSSLANAYPPTAYCTLLAALAAQLPPILAPLFALCSRLVPHSNASGHTPPSVVAILSPLLFGLTPPSNSASTSNNINYIGAYGTPPVSPGEARGKKSKDDEAAEEVLFPTIENFESFAGAYEEYIRGAYAYEHLLLAAIRERTASAANQRLGAPTRLQERVGMYPARGWVWAGRVLRRVEIVRADRDAGRCDWGGSARRWCGVLRGWDEYAVCGAPDVEDVGRVVSRPCAVVMRVGGVLGVDVDSEESCSWETDAGRRGRRVSCRVEALLDRPCLVVQTEGRVVVEERDVLVYRRRRAAGHLDTGRVPYSDGARAPLPSMRWCSSSSLSMLARLSLTSVLVPVSWCWCPGAGVRVWVRARWSPCLLPWVDDVGPGDQRLVLSMSPSTDGAAIAPHPPPCAPRNSSSQTLGDRTPTSIFVFSPAAASALDRASPLCARMSRRHAYVIPPTSLPAIPLPRLTISALSHPPTASWTARPAPPPL
ncbi:hypothetical protein C8F04DRAFT_1289008 [Mycena alexandri]|uniref:Uncharacterized protein n=1 Tax=Mycena alexandri TaxID=1745969 RepID=A0AAD6X1R1_9AGAR|nr:hypothetical protein C8F04DRAFT_1289008 [Mycena alexandri]